MENIDQTPRSSEFSSEERCGPLRLFFRKIMGWIHGHPKGAPRESMLITVECPACKEVIKVISTGGGLCAPEVRCTCGTVINNEHGYFVRSV